MASTTIFFLLCTLLPCVLCQCINANDPHFVCMEHVEPGDPSYITLLPKELDCSEEAQLDSLRALTCAGYDCSFDGDQMICAPPKPTLLFDFQVTLPQGKIRTPADWMNEGFWCLDEDGNAKECPPLERLYAPPPPPLKQAQLVLPVGPGSDEIQTLLLDAFGGYSRLAVDGVWKDPESGQVIADRNDLFLVGMECDHAAKTKFAEIALKAKEIAKQVSVYFVDCDQIAHFV